MAYNALKRIFGETKLELKLLFLFGAGLFLVIVTAFYLVLAERTAKLVYEQILGGSCGAGWHAFTRPRRNSEQPGKRNRPRVGMLGLCMPFQDAPTYMPTRGRLSCSREPII